MDRIEHAVRIFQEFLQTADPPPAEEFLASNPSVRELLEGMLERHREGPPEPDLAMGDAPVTFPTLPSIPGYELEREIGRGGQGVVFRAIQESTSRIVALKVVSPVTIAEPARRARFDREVELASSLHHPNIATVFESGVDPYGAPYLAMEFVDGQALDQYLEGPDGNRTPLDPREAVSIFTKIAGAVEHAHEKGILHRDLKPSNVLISGATEPKLVDFGLACTTARGSSDLPNVTITGFFMGTAAYSAPEQLTGSWNDVDVRTDVFALGVIFYEMLTGALPYELPEPAPGYTAYKADDLKPPRGVSETNRKVSRDVEAIALKAIAPERERRYPTVRDLIRDMERARNGDSVEARKGERWYRVRKAVRRSRALILSLVLALLVLLITVVWLVESEARADRAEAKAEGEGRRAYADQAALAARLAQTDLVSAEDMFWSDFRDDYVHGTDITTKIRWSLRQIYANFPIVARWWPGPRADRNWMAWYDEPGIIVTGGTKSITGWDSATRDLLWSRTLPDGFEQLAQAEGHVVTRSNGGIIRLYDAQTGDVRKASFELESPIAIESYDARSDEVYARIKESGQVVVLGMRTGEYRLEGPALLTLELVQEEWLGFPGAIGITKQGEISLFDRTDWEVICTTGPQFELVRNERKRDSSIKRVHEVEGVVRMSAQVHETAVIAEIRSSPGGLECVIVRRVDGHARDAHVVGGSTDRVRSTEATSGKVRFDRWGPEEGRDGRTLLLPLMGYSHGGLRPGDLGVIAGVDGVIRFVAEDWTSVPETIAPSGSRQTYHTVCLHPNGTEILAVGDTRIDANDRNTRRLVEVWASSTDRPKRIHVGSDLNARHATSCSYNSDGSLYAIGSRDGSVEIVSASTHEAHEKAVRLVDRVTDIAFHPKENIVAWCGYDDRKVFVWDLDSDSHPHQLEWRGSLDNRMSALVWSHDGRRLVGSQGKYGGAVVWWNRDDWSEGGALETPVRLRAVAVHPSLPWVATGGHDGRVRIIDLETRNERAAAAHSSHVLAVEFHPDGSLLVSGDADGTIRVWEVPELALLAEFEQREAYTRESTGSWQNGVFSIDFHTSGNRFVTGGQNSTLLLWDFSEVDHRIEQLIADRKVHPWSED